VCAFNDNADRKASRREAAFLLVGWKSGLIQQFAKLPYLKGYRGFESLTHRQISVFVFMPSNKTNLKKAQQLGMPWGTAAHRLRQRLFFSLLVKLGENVCFKCGKHIESSSELSIEHKQDWLDNDPALFWDESNVAYSHRKCNKAGRHAPKTGKHGTNGIYVLGCRCRPCTDAHVKWNNEWRWKKGLRNKR
jgi:hypothetical protein